jgi:[ribosomal protein S5]-alanine N-acetyltransferase
VEERLEENRLIVTARTILRPMMSGDAPALFRWRSDPEVMHFSAYGPDAKLEATEKVLGRAMAVDASLGFSRWLVLDRESSEPIGDAGVLPMPEGDDFELGYRLQRSCWGRGLATEIARAWVAHVQATSDLPRLLAFTHREHRTSQRILQKVGFQRASEGLVYGMPSFIHRMDFAR